METSDSSQKGVSSISQEGVNFLKNRKETAARYTGTQETKGSRYFLLDQLNELILHCKCNFIDGENPF